MYIYIYIYILTLPLVALINHILTCRIYMWSDPHVDGQSPWILLCRAGKWYDLVWRWPLGAWAPLGSTNRSENRFEITSDRDSSPKTFKCRGGESQSRVEIKSDHDSPKSLICYTCSGFTSGNHGNTTPVTVSEVNIAQMLRL